MTSVIARCPREKREVGETSVPLTVYVPLSLVHGICVRFELTTVKLTGCSTIVLLACAAASVVSVSADAAAGTMAAAASAAAAVPATRLHARASDPLIESPLG